MCLIIIIIITEHLTSENSSFVSAGCDAATVSMWTLWDAVHSPLWLPCCVIIVRHRCCRVSTSCRSLLLHSWWSRNVLVITARLSQCHTASPAIHIARRIAICIAITPAITLITFNRWATFHIAMWSVGCQIFAFRWSLSAFTFHLCSPLLTNCRRLVDISSWRLAGSIICIWMRLWQSRGSLWLVRSSIYKCISSWQSGGPRRASSGRTRRRVWHCPTV